VVVKLRLVRAANRFSMVRVVKLSLVRVVSMVRVVITLSVFGVHGNLGNTRLGGGNCV